MTLSGCCLKSLHADLLVDRGSIVGLHAQFIGTGYAISNWIGFAMYYTEGQFTVSIYGS